MTKIMTSSIYRYEKNYIEKNSMHLTIKLFILWWPIFYFLIWCYYDIFLSPHFSFSMCDKHSVIISKVHNESILFLKLIHNFNKIFTKVYYNMGNEKMKKLIVWYILLFKFICNPKNYNYHSPNSPPICVFTLMLVFSA
jgi:hypothetical protein